MGESPAPPHMTVTIAEVAAAIAQDRDDAFTAADEAVDALTRLQSSGVWLALPLEARRQISATRALMAGIAQELDCYEE